MLFKPAPTVQKYEVRTPVRVSLVPCWLGPTMCIQAFAPYPELKSDLFVNAHHQGHVIADSRVSGLIAQYGLKSDDAVWWLHSGEESVQIVQGLETHRVPGFDRGAAHMGKKDHVL